MKKMRVDLRAVLYKERDSGLWVSHCLEMDIMGHGATRNEAFNMMIDAVVVQVEESLKHKNLDNLFMAADPHIFRMYSEGQELARGVLEFHEDPIVERDDVAVDASAAREYDSELMCV